MRTSRLRLNFAGHAGRIVVGGVQQALVLLQIDAEDHQRAVAENGARAAQEGAGLVRLEIADASSPGKKPTFGMSLTSARQLERRGEVGRHRMHREGGKILAQRVACALRKSPEISTGT